MQEIADEVLHQFFERRLPARGEAGETLPVRLLAVVARLLENEALRRLDTAPEHAEEVPGAAPQGLHRFVHGVGDGARHADHEMLRPKLPPVLSGEVRV